MEIKLDKPLTQSTADPRTLHAEGFIPIEHARAFLEEMERLFLQQQEPIAILKLATYAADAMRVLQVLEQHANMSPPFADTLKNICPDWRNPGAIEQPADLIALALMQAIASLHQVHKGMELAIQILKDPAP